MNILIIIKVKILVLIKWSNAQSLPPPILLTIESRMVMIFCTHNPISYKRMSLWYSFLKPHLTLDPSNISFQSREVIE